MRAIKEDGQVALKRMPPIRNTSRQRPAPAEDVVPQAAAGFGNQVKRRAHVGVFARFDQDCAHGTPLAWSGRWYPMSHQATTSIRLLPAHLAAQAAGGGDVAVAGVVHDHAV